MNVQQRNESSGIVKQQNIHQQNYVPTNQKKIDNQRTLSPTENNNSTVIN